MTIYRYADASAVKEVVIHHAKDRPPMALLSAADTATPEQLSAVRAAIEAAGWQEAAAHVEGKPVLQITGFEGESELDGFLRNHRFTQGQAVITPQTEDNHPSTPREQIERNSLKLAGALNIFGNTLLMVDGSKKHEKDSKRDYYRITGGGLLLLGAANLVRYGNATREHYTQEVKHDLVQYIHAEGGQPSADGSTAPQQRGTLARMENFLYRYPAQVTLGVDAVGAASNLLSGIKRTRSDGEWGGLGFGISSLGLKLASLAIPEQSNDEKKNDEIPKKRNFIEKAIDWVKEKPLRLYGYGSLVNDAFLGVQAYQQYKPGKMNHVFTAGAAVSYTLADLMMAISSKDHVNAEGKFTPDEQRGIEVIAAAAVAARPEAERMPMAQKLGNFLARRREMQGDISSISQSIIEQARHRQENPWVNRIDKGTDSLPGSILGA